MLEKLNLATSLTMKMSMRTKRVPAGGDAERYINRGHVLSKRFPLCVANRKNITENTMREWKPLNIPRVKIGSLHTPTWWEWNGKSVIAAATLWMLVTAAIGAVWITYR